MNRLKKKLARLKKIISGYRSCLVAFSGGVDSTFLLKVATLALPKDKLLAVTASSETYPEEELLFSKDMARRLGARHKVIKTAELRDKRFVSNPVNRCYFCKKELFSTLSDIAGKYGLNIVADASNRSDKSDLRPGDRAKRECRVRSPLQEACLNKEEIRKLSKGLGLCTWDKPSLACLASRLPYGTEISGGILRRIGRAEAYLKKAGFKQVRLRHYGKLCRIEVDKDDIPRLIKEGRQLVDKLKGLGYNYVTVDMEGYRTGSMNEVIRR